MPVVPRRNPLPGVATTARPALRPGNAFTPPEPVDIGPAARQVAGFVEQARERADQLVLLEADNRLSDIAAGIHGQATQKRGKDALSAEEEVESEWTRQVSEVEQTLTNDRQRANFQARAAHRQQNLRQSVRTHTANELRKYDDQETESALKNRINDAVQNYADPKLVGQAVAEAKYLVDLYADRNGWSPEARTEKRDTVASGIHRSVIGRMVENGQDQGATEYFTKFKTEVKGDDLLAVERALEVATTEGEGLRGADDIWKRLGPKSPNDAVTLAAMEQEALDKYSDQPKVLKAIRTELRTRKEAHNEEQRETAASNKATILGAFAKGANVGSLVRSAAYLALDGTNQEQLKNYMTDSRRADANREPDKKNWAAFWKYSEPAKLASMSENQILSLAPEIGQGLVNQLMSQKRTVLKTDDQVRSATIDADLFNTTATDAGLDPYDKDTDKAVLGRLRNTVELEIGRAQQNQKRALTGDEKQGIMQRVLDQHIMVDRWGRSDQAERAATLSRDDRGAAYFPLSSIPDRDAMSAVQLLREMGTALPGDNAHTVLRKFQRRIEKAYAAKMLGRGEQEQLNILAGK